MSISTRSTINCTPEINAGYGLHPHLQESNKGTFGGWVELKNPDSGVWVPFGLTCTHCVLPLDNGLTEHQRSSVQGWRRNGVPFADTQAAEMLLMDSPPRSDLNSGIQTITAEIEKLRQGELYRKITKAHADDEYVMPLEERRWQIVHSTIEKHQNEKKLLEKYLEKDKCTFGCVMAASGVKEKPRKSVQPRDSQKVPSIPDWALIRPTKHPIRTVGTNEIAYATSSRSGPRSLGDFEVRELQVDERLGKVGYDTGFTRGDYSGLRAVSITTRIVNGKEETYESWEHVVTRGSSEIPIVERGDSGSLVFDDTGAVVGMCSGGTDTGDVLYFTHIGDVLESIQEVTGVHDIRLRA